MKLCARSNLGDQRIIFLTLADSIIGTQRFARLHVRARARVWDFIRVYVRGGAYFIRYTRELRQSAAVHFIYAGTFYVRACSREKIGDRVKVCGGTLRPRRSSSRRPLSHRAETRPLRSERDARDRRAGTRRERNMRANRSRAGLREIKKNATEAASTKSDFYTEILTFRENRRLYVCFYRVLCREHVCRVNTRVCKNVSYARHSRRKKNLSYLIYSSLNSESSCIIYWNPSTCLLLFASLLSLERISPS